MPAFTNQATLTYGGNTTNSNIVTGEIVDVLSAEKRALNTTYNRDDTVTYVINLVNTGSTALNGLVLNDNLGAYTFGTTTVYPLTYVDGTMRLYVNGAAQPNPQVTATEPLSATGINIPAGGNATIIYQATVNNFAPLDTGNTINNAVNFTGAGLTEPVTADAVITASDEALLAISKSVSPTTVSENETLNYTFIIQNIGNASSGVTENAVVSDTLNPILDPITVTYDGTPWTENVNYTYDRTTGIFRTTDGQITVPAATFTQDPTTGAYIITPGTSVLTISGTV